MFPISFHKTVASLLISLQVVVKSETLCDTFIYGSSSVHFSRGFHFYPFNYIILCINNKQKEVSPLHVIYVANISEFVYL